MKRKNKKVAAQQESGRDRSQDIWMSSDMWDHRELESRRAAFVYEGARLAAIAAGAPIVPEPWEERTSDFKSQFHNVIAQQCSDERKTSPEELHDDWVQAYETMGWQFGWERDPVAKTHPDMVPYGELGQLERDRDAVFIALCEIARLQIREEVPA